MSRTEKKAFSKLRERFKGGQSIRSNRGSSAAFELLLFLFPRANFIGFANAARVKYGIIVSFTKYRNE